MPALIGLFLLCLLQLGIDSEVDQSEKLLLFDFGAEDTSSWQIVNDGVMGGRSQGFVSVDDDMLTFSGTLVTRGGGFTSVRTRRLVDLSEYDGIELRVRGTGRTFELEVDDGTRRWGRSVSRRAPFETTGIWSVVQIPFSTLRSSIFGQSVNSTPIDLENVRGFALFILDGKDGPFKLQVDEVSAYKNE